MATVVGHLHARLSAGTAAFEKDMTRASRSVTQMQSTLGGLKLSSIAAFTGISLGAAALGSAIRSAFSTIKDSIVSQLEAIDEVGKASDQIGITTEALIGLRHAADLAGIDATALDKSLGRMQRSLSDAALKGGETAQVFQALGIDAKELVKAAPDEAFKVIADKIKGIENPTLRAKAAFDIFGRAGQELLSLLLAGSGAITAFQARAELLQQFVSREMAQSIEDANDAMLDMRTAASGLSRALAVGLAPTIEKLADGLTLATLNAGKLLDTLGRLAVFGVTGQGAGLPASLDRLGQGLTETAIGLASTKIGAKGQGGEPTEFDFDAFGGERKLDDLDRAMEESAREAEQLVKSRDKFLEKLRDERDMLGMTADQVARFTALEMGATDAEAEQAAAMTRTIEQFKKQEEAVKDLARTVEQERDKIKDAARALIDETRTPLEEFEKKVQDISRLRLVGAIDTATFKRGIAAAQAELAQAQKVQPTGAFEIGSRGAASIMARSLNTRQTPESQTAKNTELLVTLFEGANTLIAGLPAAINRGAAAVINVLDF